MRCYCWDVGIVSYSHIVPLVRKDFSNILSIKGRCPFGMVEIYVKFTFIYGNIKTIHN